MPATDQWMVFLGTAVVFAVTPGPAMLYVLARTLHGGRRPGLESALGNAIGTVVHVCAAAAGLAALLSASPAAYALVKYVGAGYLAVLGVQAIRQRRGAALMAGDDVYARSPLAQGVVVETLNPKTALYFMALLPHFVHPERAHPAMVLAVLGLIVVVIVLAADVTVALAAGRLHGRLARSERWQVRQRAGSGALMIGLGTFVAVS
ncbi:Threonine/homoserine/homoserine lactone efflux protein [Jiangella alba]|uniref:Threonine/homoserine/homoserine lactone efflux protein n=2 Tax=Jiangella alba TaxID=561176 RepID=A0A1H5PZ16_9ACTN|nr:Threonine/homoserine/homoserine lactone efflux protein [Jiangella alba]